MCSHLCDSDLQCAVLFCNAHRLLELTAAESVNQVVIWRKVGGAGAKWVCSLECGRLGGVLAL